MSRSHLAVRHLLRELDLKREQQIQRQIIPDWFSPFVEGISELFEPFRGVARVGYECAQAEGGWEVSIFLGETEIVGGAADGHVQPVNFRFDLVGLQEYFEKIESMHWNAFPDTPVEEDTPDCLTFLTVRGTVEQQSVQLQVHVTAPYSVGPAMRQHIDGRLELV